MRHRARGLPRRQGGRRARSSSRPSRSSRRWSRPCAAYPWPMRAYVCAESEVRLHLQRLARPEGQAEGPALAEGAAAAAIRRVGGRGRRPRHVAADDAASAPWSAAGTSVERADELERFVEARCPDGCAFERDLLSLARHPRLSRLGGADALSYSRPTMPTARMRRVNEVMREVIGAAIATELEDPRIGFVTVTSVETSPDLRQRASTSACSAATRSARRRSPGFAPPTACSRPEIAARDADQAHADPELPLRRDARARRADLAGCSRMSERGSGRGGGRTERRSRRWPRSCAPRDRFLLTTHEGPDGDALGSLLAMHHVLDPARQGLGDVPGGEGVPAAGRVPLPAPRGGLPRAAGRRRRPRDRLPRLRQHRPHAGRLPAARRAPRS